MWMLHCAQHDKSESMDASLRLRCVQHDNSDSVIPSTARNSPRGCFTSLSRTRQGQNKRASATLALNFYTPNAQLLDQHHLPREKKTARPQLVKIHPTA